MSTPQPMPPRSTKGWPCFFCAGVYTPALASLPLLETLPKSPLQQRSNPWEAIIATLVRQTLPSQALAQRLLQEPEVEAEPVEAQLVLQPWEPLAVASLVLRPLLCLLLLLLPLVAGARALRLLPRGYPPALAPAVALHLPLPASHWRPPML